MCLTRARKRCFVFDTSVERRSPVFAYLHRHGVAELGLEQVLSVSATKCHRSTADDWLRQGDNLYTNKLWAHAEQCYLKSGDEVRALEAGGSRGCNRHDKHMSHVHVTCTCHMHMHMSHAHAHAHAHVQHVHVNMYMHMYNMSCNRMCM